MTDAECLEWGAMYQLLAHHYPDLPLHQAYIELLRDAYIRFPQEFLKMIKTTFPQMGEQLPEVLMVAGTCSSRPELALSCKVLGILAKARRAASASEETRETLKKISSELRTFRNPGLFGQIANINAILTSNAAVYYIKRMAEQAERIGDGLERIGDHIRSKNIRGDTFPGHVHSYVKSMIERHREESVPHYFFVFNQGTEWQPKFDDINREDPLGPHYLGYSHDLDELVDFLVGTARPRLGSEVVFHILIPVVSQLAIAESLTFPDEMGPFRVSGQLGDGGLPSVYLCMPLEKDRVNLRDIGSLSPRPRWVFRQRVGLAIPLLYRWLSTELEPVYYEDPFLKVETIVDSPVYCSVYYQCESVPPRTLGARRTT